MKKLHNPEMDELVHETNRLLERDAGAPRPLEVEGDGRTKPTLDPPELGRVAAAGRLADVLGEMLRLEATDLLLAPSEPPVVRVAGRLHRLGERPVELDEVERMFAPHLGDRSRRSLEVSGSADLSLRLEAAAASRDRPVRLRVNVQRVRRGLTAAVRVLPERVPGLVELGLPESLSELVAAPRGLVLVSGPTGCGKSTTLAALIEEVNRRQLRHVITIEDPIEYEHRNREAVVEQIEIGRDAPSFATALRSALRRDPDVLLVGEMRDPETMATVVTAAETGHLILSTLHTADVAHAVHRIVDAFPADQQKQVRHQLALSLSAVVCQQLVPRRDGGGRVPAVEVLIATGAVRNHIRRGQLERIPNELLTGRAVGMCSMEDSLAELVRRGMIEAEEARARTMRPDDLERRLQVGGDRRPER
jgi:twitching motility protein PilT